MSKSSVAPHPTARDSAAASDPTGEAKHVLSFTEDMTQQRQIEEQRRHAHKMEALGELAGGLAHDLNNLLAIVIGNLDILKELRTGDASKDELVTDAMAAALSGSELTRRLLAFARGQTLQPTEASPEEGKLEAPPLAPAQTRGETILVVEDNKMLRQMVVKQLVSLGLQVLDVADARAALDLLASRGGVDLLFTDVVLPGDMDGCALAREVIRRWPQSKILLTSGYPGTRIAEAVGPGAPMRLVSKPYRKEELVRALHEALDERGTG